MSFFSGLFHRFRGAFDPNRVAMSRAFLAGDYGAAAEQFRQLQAEHERLRTWDRKKRKADAAFDSDGYAALEDSLKSKLGFDSAPMPHQQFEPSAGAGSAESFINSVGQSARRDLHGAPHSGTGPPAVFGAGADDAARTGAFDDDRGVDGAIGSPDFAQTLRRPPDDMMFPLAAFNLPQESDPRLRAKRPAPNARSGESRESGQLGISAQAPQPWLVDVMTAPAIQASKVARNLMPPGADGRIGNAYADPDYLPVEQSVERRYGLPAGILSAIRTRGERSNADQVSEAGARSVYQITLGTRRLFRNRYGVDAWAGPAEAARVAALHLLESYKQHRDWNRAILEYHAGPNRRNWGPRTRAYGERVGDFNGRK